MSEKIDKMADGVFSAIRGYIKSALDPRDEEIKSLKARMAALEERPVMKYHGVWDKAQQYGEGDFVTDHGSMWHCKRATRNRPPGDDWQQCVQRGRDGKDAR